MEWATALHNKATARLPKLFDSLAAKLTLAFLLVGVLGVLIFALLIGQRSRAEFTRFLSDRDDAILVNALGDYYSANGDWAGVRLLLASPPLNFYTHDILLLDANGVVVGPNRDFRLDERVPLNEVTEATALIVDGQTVGHVVWLPSPMGPGGMGHMGRGMNSGMDGSMNMRPPALLESEFWERILWAAVVSGVITVLLALLLGWWLARTLTAPVRALTNATQAMAAGDLNQRVPVASQDEIGDLAHAFNQMSADLAHASQLRKQMTADLAHDLRTPLSILRGYLQGLKETQIQGSPDLYALMHDEVLHLQRLVEDLRVLSLADAGELSLNRRMVDPAALLERTGLLYVVAAEQQGVQLRVEASDALPSIDVDTDRMAQVLNNLVSNALRHTHEGEVVLAAQVHDGQLWLSIRDTGSGIAAEDLPFVFDRFYRGDKARQRSDNAASGLGLAIAKAIVEAHGGTIQAASTLGRGTTFTIRLPTATREGGAK